VSWRRERKQLGQSAKWPGLEDLLTPLSAGVGFVLAMGRSPAHHARVTKRAFQSEPVTAALGSRRGERWRGAGAAPEKDAKESESKGKEKKGKSGRV